MSQRNDHTLSTGLSISLLLHGGLIIGVLWIYIHKLNGQLWQPAPSRLIAQATGTIDPTEPTLGEESGIGSAIAAVDGDQEMLAMKADENQPFASLDPSGFGHVGDPPSPSPLPTGANGNNAPAALGLPENSPPQQPQLTQILPRPVTQDENPAGDGPPPAVAVASVEPDSRSTQKDSTGQPGAPGAAAPSADPAPQTDSEIDPFSKEGTAVFRPGKTTVQFGRKAKLTRPDILLAGQLDLIGVAHPSVTLAISTDATGKVSNAVVQQSSGSLNIDQPVRIAAFDWWFEPPKDSAGRPVPDHFKFTVSFVG
jgi:TonB family protein